MKYIAKTPDGIIKEWEENYAPAYEKFYMVHNRHCALAEWRTTDFVKRVTDLAEVKDFIAQQSKQFPSALYKLTIGNTRIHSLWGAGECIYENKEVK